LILLLAYTTATNNNTNPPYPSHFPGQYFGNVYPALSPITSGTPYPQSTQASVNSNYPFSMANRIMPSYAAPSVTTASNTDTISKEHIRLSLMSALEDKLKARSKEISSQYNAEIGVLKKTGIVLDYLLNFCIIIVYIILLLFR